MTDEKPAAAYPTLLIRVAPPLFAVLASCFGAWSALHLWNAHFGVPFMYGGDQLSHTMHLAQLVQNGWVWEDGRLGAPFDQTMQEWPMGDVLSLITGWFFALFTDNWFAVANGVFLISFPLVALSAWWALHRLGLTSWSAAVMAVLYSLLPYHFVRGEHHLFLSSYYVVPLGVYLAVRLLQGAQLFIRENKWRTAQTVLLCVLIGLGGIYYAAFTLLFVMTAMVVKLLQRQSILPSVLVIGSIVGAVLIATAPAIIYEMQHGANTSAAVRNAFESDVYGLKLAQMLAPAPGHRIDALDDYQQSYLDSFPLPSERGSAALGIVGSFGLLWMLGIALATLIRGPFAGEAQAQIRRFSAFSIVGFVVATIGGLSTLLGILVMGDIRSWNRMSVFIGLFALGTVGLLLDSLARALKTRVQLVSAVALAGVLVIGYLDQVTPRWAPPYENLRVAFFDHQKYFREIESRMDPGASVFILPRMEFPESHNIVDIKSNDQLIPYLHTRTLKWSFGGMRGRTESEWQERIRTQDTQEMLTDMVAAGFSGLLVDQYGYEDRGAALNDSLKQVLDTEPFVNGGDRYAFYDLRGFANQLRATSAAELDARRAELLYPVTVVDLANFFGWESDGKSEWAWADGVGGSVIVENTTSKDQKVKISMELGTAGDTPSKIFISWPDGQQQAVDVAGKPVVVSRELVVDEDLSEVDVVTNAPSLPAGTDSRDLRLKVIDADVMSVN